LRRSFTPKFESQPSLSQRREFGFGLGLGISFAKELKPNSKTNISRHLVFDRERPKIVQRIPKKHKEIYAKHLFCAFSCLFVANPLLKLAALGWLKLLYKKTPGGNFLREHLREAVDVCDCPRVYLVQRH
jgi:ribosomal protein L34E